MSFDTTTESIRRNANKDLVTTKNGNEWSAAFLGTKAKDEWNEPARAGVGWWEGIEKVVGEVLVTAGGDEGLVDGIRDVTGKLEVSRLSPSSHSFIPWRCWDKMARTGKGASVFCADAAARCGRLNTRKSLTSKRRVSGMKKVVSRSRKMGNIYLGTPFLHSVDRGCSLVI